MAYGASNFLFLFFHSLLFARQTQLLEIIVRVIVVGRRTIDIFFSWKWRNRDFNVDVKNHKLHFFLPNLSVDPAGVFALNSTDFSTVIFGNGMCTPSSGADELKMASLGNRYGWCSCVITDCTRSYSMLLRCEPGTSIGWLRAGSFSLLDANKLWAVGRGSWPRFDVMVICSSTSSMTWSAMRIVPCGNLGPAILTVLDEWPSGGVGKEPEIIWIFDLVFFPWWAQHFIHQNMVKNLFHSVKASEHSNTCLNYLRVYLEIVNRLGWRNVEVHWWRC